MKQRIYQLLCMAAAAVLLTGCGGEYAGISGDGVVSDGAVSGAAVTGSAVEVNEEAGKENTFPNFCTDTDWYRTGEEGIIQSRLDGSEAKVILKEKKKESHWLLSVVDGYVYYEISDFRGKTGSDSVCRAPIQKDKDGNDRVLEQEKETLITVERKEIGNDEVGITNIFINSQFILYAIVDADHKHQMIQYDLETGKKQKAGISPADIKDESAEAFTCGDHILTKVFLEGTFIRETEGGKWTKISDYNAVECEEDAWNDRYYFFSDTEEKDGGVLNFPNCIYRYELKSGAKEQMVSYRQLIQAAQEAQGLTDEKSIDACAVTDLFCQGDRLYFQVQLNWKEGKEYRMAYLMFSQGQEESQCRYEKNLTECMRGHGIWRKGRWETEVFDDETDEDMHSYQVVEDVVCNDGRCYDMINGKAYMMYCDEYYSDKWQADRIGCYDLMTGEFRWLTESDPEYFEPAYKYSRAEGYFSDEESYSKVKYDIGTRMKYGPVITEGILYDSMFSQFQENE